MKIKIVKLYPSILGLKFRLKIYLNHLKNTIMTIDRCLN